MSSALCQYKRDMRQFLIEHYSFNRWCLLVDWDEFFDYPCSDKLPLSSLLKWLDRHRYNAVLTQLLDMFPRDTLQTKSDEEALGFRQPHRWFEVNSIERKELISGMDNQATTANLNLNYGGICNRVCGNYPFLSKFALLKPNFRLQIASSHLIQWARIADITCLLLHYKFLSNFSEI
jgi:hypothetical protein